MALYCLSFSQKLSKNMAEKKCFWYRNPIMWPFHIMKSKQIVGFVFEVFFLLPHPLHSFCLY